ncbi:PD-(D/E)XK nuclease family protein [Actinomadura rubteroloni]|nr:PD-(D/E)XK nuclease family protein [Actinomadura rubteroloni]
MTGDTNFIRVQPANVRDNDESCPQQLALMTHPAVTRETAVPRRSRLRTTSSLNALRAVLDLIEFDHLPPDAALARWRDSAGHRCHPGLAAWTAEAVRNYLIAAETIDAASGMAENPAFEPVTRDWARRRTVRNGDVPLVHEETVMGRRHAGPEIRELRLIRTSSVANRARDEAEIALAAGVLADARPVLGSSRGKPYVLGRPAPVRRVRIVEIGCADGSHNVLFDDSPQAARDKYRRDAEKRVHAVSAGGEYRPGNNCGRCVVVDLCPAVPVRPGLLGISAPAGTRRSWSISTGRAYRICPARSHFADLFLPRDRQTENSGAPTRGNAVHAFIEERHRRTPAQACRSDEAPTTREGWRAGTHSVTGFEARLGIQMIGDHALVCPLGRLHENADILPERYVVAYDPSADVVVIAKTDLVYRAADSWVLRETKTTARSLNDGDLLDRIPQLALGLVLSAEGVLPGGRGGCRVELERLTSTGPVVSVLDATDPELVERARRIVTAYAEQWREDELFPTRPGKECKGCGFVRWCPDAPKGAAP